MVLVEPGGAATAPAPLWIPPPPPVTAVAATPSDDNPHTSSATRAPEPGDEQRGSDDSGGRGRGDPGR
ncbi:hypothetical protein [Amycolatopsis sp. NPDC051903]|uniref:hypothetical protein n=1 Tax=Amycolatopsis sp. NPDC051903 TaxID=3363936 RepID=UPI0037AE2997